MSERRQSRQATNAWSCKDPDIEFVQSLSSSGRPRRGEFSARERDRAHRAADCLVDAATETPMFFGTTQGDMAGINGAIFPQPALVWLAMDHSLWSGHSRESPSRGRYQALCGSLLECVRHRERLPGIDAGPDASTVASIPQWEQSFYESEFTHGNVGDLRAIPRLRGLWKELAVKRSFPQNH